MRNPSSEIIVCAGMARSGSTWLYNALRLILKTRGSVYARWIDDYDARNACPTHLVKIHRSSPELMQSASFVFTSRRHLKYVAASLVRKKYDTQTGLIRLLRGILLAHERWSRCSDYEVVYERMMDDPLGELGRVRDVLDITVDDSQIADFDRNLRSLHHAPNTFLVNQIHQDHRASESYHYSEFLDSETIQKIDQEFGEWMRRFGYVD